MAEIKVAPKDKDPLGQLADNLGVERRPDAPWGAFKSMLLIAPLLVATAVGMQLNGAWQALVFTFVGAAASIQAAGPYSRLLDRLEESVKSMKDSRYSIWTGVSSLIRFWWRPSGMLGTRSVGPRRVYLPVMRWQYRLLARQVRRYFFALEGRVIDPDSSYVTPALIPKGSAHKPRYIPNSFWRRRQSVVLKKLGRDLIRSTGNVHEDEAVNHLATVHSIPYKKPRTAKKRSRRYRAPLDKSAG